MSLPKREFLQLLGAAAAAGFGLGRSTHAQAASAYDVPRHGQVSLLHFTDCHAQLKPLYYREPHVNLGLGDAAGQPSRTSTSSAPRAAMAASAASRTWPRSSSS